MNSGRKIEETGNSVVVFFFKVSMNLIDREGEREKREERGEGRGERERFSIHWLIPKMPAMTRAGWQPEARNQIQVSPWLPPRACIGRK